jgi:hypothetical protein
MIIKVFILGLPGSGKSEAARYIDSYVKEKPVPGTSRYWFAAHFNDYSILDAMSKHPVEGLQFTRPETGGFDVLDIRAFDIALKRLEKKIADSIPGFEADREETIVIEFARNDYKRTFNQFDKDFIQDAYFIYLSTKVEVCKKRIRDRVLDEEHVDDYPVSEYIFKTYYHSDDGQDLPNFLKQDFGIDESRVLIIDNNYSLDEAIKRIAPFIDRIIDSAPARESNI